MTTELIIAPPVTGKTTACIQRIRAMQTIALWQEFGLLYPIVCRPPHFAEDWQVLVVLWEPMSGHLGIYIGVF